MDQDKVSSPIESPDSESVERFALDVYDDGQWSSRQVGVVRELPLSIYINGQELITILCTPHKLNCLVLGFLYSENLITGLEEVLTLRLCPEDFLADVRLSRQDYALPTRRSLTSGCGGGGSFVARQEGLEPLHSKLTVDPLSLLSSMGQLQGAAHLYRSYGGIHTSALGDGQKLSVVAEDIGRHNTLDKIQGECLLRNLPTSDHLLLTTGRLSSEMVHKAARMAVPIVVSRSSATSQAILLAQELGITLVGYVRGRRLSVYTHRNRITGASP